MSTLPLDSADPRNGAAVAAWITFAVFVTAFVGIEATRESGRIASIWLANAVVLLALLRTSPGWWARWLLCGLIGNMAANLMTGDASRMAFVLALCNSLEILLAGWLFRLWDSREKPDLTRLKSLFTFIGVAGMVAPAAAGAMAALALHISQGLPFWHAFRTWFAADALGLLIIVPLFAGTAADEFARILRSPSRMEALAILALVPAVTVTIVLGNHFPWIFLLGPLFLWAAFRFGFVGVASAIFLAAASGIGTLVYVVPHIRHLPDLREEIAFLQLFLFTNVLIFLPIANLIKALQKSEGRYRSIMETTQDGFWIADLQGHLLQVNEGYCRMSGYRAQELLSMNISELETIESHSEVAEHIRTIMTKGSDRFETWHRRKDGTTYEVEISAQCCPEIENAVITFARDITRRKQAETSLRDSNEKFAKIYQLSPDAIDLTNLETGLHLETNPAHQKMFGYTREETIGHTAFPEDLNMWVNKEDREQFISRLEESGEVFGLEASMRRRGGDVFNALLSSSIVDINGERCLLTVCRDISQPKAAEIALRISEEKYSKVFRSAPILVALSHIDNGLLIDINDLYCQTFEYLREELIGKTTIELGLIKPEERQRITNLVDSKGNVKNIELSMYTKTQKTIPCLFSGETIEINGVKFLVSMLVDLTSLKQIEEHERNLEAQLYHNQKMESLGILSAGVAHNLNNVLGIIMGTASLHEKVAAEPSDREAYQTISKACARGRGVVKSMLHFAQPSLQVKAPVELHKVIQEVCVLLESTTKNAITISEGLVDEPLWIHGDSGTINHALLNICLNSIGAMPDGGTLEFRTAILEENLVEVSVRDNGTGMPPEVLAHVMEPFFTTKETGKGTGLGLSMTYGMVKAHGGTIAIVSQPGQGTTVTLRFPRIPAPVEGETVKAAPPVLAAMKVFLVDDDEDVRFLMTRMLKKAGVRQVKVFPGGKDALESLPSGELPDLIILDQNMPGLTGVQTMELIRNVHMDLPILISSGQPDIEAWDCFKQPKVGVISKPFTLDEIQAKLAQFVLESSKDLRNDPLAR